MADSDGEGLSILPHVLDRRGRHDKAVAVCNGGCGATRNIYLTSVDFTFGKIRKPVESQP